MKFFFLLFIVSSLLLGLSEKQQNYKYIKEFNDARKREGSSMQMYKYEILYSEQRFDYALEVDFSSVNKDSLNNLMYGLCADILTKKYINKGWSYNYYYRNKSTKEKVIEFTVNKSTCRQY